MCRWVDGGGAESRNTGTDGQMETARHYAQRRRKGDGEMATYMESFVLIHADAHAHVAVVAEAVTVLVDRTAATAATELNFHLFACAAPRLGHARSSVLDHGRGGGLYTNTGG